MAFEVTPRFWSREASPKPVQHWRNCEIIPNRTAMACYRNTAHRFSNDNTSFGIRLLKGTFVIPLPNLVLDSCERIDKRLICLPP